MTQKHVLAEDVKGGARVDGFRAVFLRDGGHRLDREDRYESDWIGHRGGGPETPLGATADPVIGIHGGAGHDLDALGLVVQKCPE